MAAELLCTESFVKSHLLLYRVLGSLLICARSFPAPVKGQWAFEVTFFQTPTIPDCSPILCQVVPDNGRVGDLSKTAATYLVHHRCISGSAVHHGCLMCCCGN